MAAKKKAKAKPAASSKSKRDTAPRKTPARKTAKKKTAAKKVAKSKTTKKAAGASKKAVAKKPAAKKPAVKKAPVKKAAAPKAASKKAAAKKPPTKPVPSPETQSPPKKKAPAKRLNKKELEFFRKLLLNVRDQVVDEITFLAGNNLNREHVASSSEDGSDNFERELALKLVGAEQDIVYEIDEALARIHNGTYGICELSGEPIEKERLKVLPHARYCVQVQSEIEKGRTRYRPFGPSLSRSISD